MVTDTKLLSKQHGSRGHWIPNQDTGKLCRVRFSWDLAPTWMHMGKVLTWLCGRINGTKSSVNQPEQAWFEASNEAPTLGKERGMSAPTGGGT